MIIERRSDHDQHAELSKRAGDWFIEYCPDPYFKEKAIRPNSYFPSGRWSTEAHWNTTKNFMHEITGDGREYDCIFMTIGTGWAWVAVIEYTMEYNLNTEAIYKHIFRIDDETLAIQFKLAVM